MVKRELWQQKIAEKALTAKKRTAEAVGAAEAAPPEDSDETEGNDEGPMGEIGNGEEGLSTWWPNNYLVFVYCGPFGEKEYGLSIPSILEDESAVQDELAVSRADKRQKEQRPGKTHLLRVV